MLAARRNPAEITRRPQFETHHDGTPEREEIEMSERSEE